MSSMIALGAVLVVAAPTVAEELPVEEGSTKLVYPSKRHIFGTQWFAPIVRRGFDRTVPVSLGAPGIAADQGVLILGTGEGELRGYRLNTGAPLWSVDYQVPFLGPVTVLHGGDAFAVTTSADGTLIAFEITTGEIRWETKLDGESLAPAVRAGDRLLVTTVDNKVSAVAVNNGERLWTSGRPKPTQLTVRGHGAPAVAGETVVAAFSDGYVEAYGVGNGRVRWSRPVALGEGSFTDSDADPTIVDDRVFVGSYSRGVFALGLDDGRTIWTRRGPAITSLAVHDDLLVVGSADGFVWGLQQSDGASRYRVRLPPGSASRMSRSDELIVFASGDAGIVALRGATGEPLQATPLVGRPGGEADVDGEFVATISSRGYVYVMRRGAAGLISSRGNWPGP